MSLFKTFLPVQVEEVLSKLPNNKFVHFVSYDNELKRITILWEYDKFQSGLTVPIEFPIEMIGTNKLPAGIKDLNKKEPVVVQEIPQEPTVFEEEIKVEPKQNYIITKEAFEEAYTSGKELEYQGVLPVWNPIEKDHVFTEGFFYREVGV